MKKILKTLLVFTFIVLFIPTLVNAEDTRIVVSNVELTSDMEEPTYGGEVKTYYTYETVVGEPAYMTPHMGSWYKKVDENWIRYNDPVFKEGTYRWSNQLRIDNGGSTYILSDETALTVDGNVWTLASTMGIYETYSMGYYNSPEYVVNKVEGYELTFRNSSNYNISKNYVNNPITTYSVANAVLGGTEPYTFSKTSGPDWITVSSDGLISGTPTIEGQNENLVIRVTDAEDIYKEITVTVEKTNMDPVNRTTVLNVELTSNMEEPTYGGEVKKLTVDGKEWTLDNYMSIYETYSMGWYWSPEFVVNKDISNTTVEGLKVKYYTGNEIEQDLTIKYEDTVLKENTDYKLSYKNNTNVGIATVTITGIGEYTGSKELRFKINKSNISTVTISTIADKTYTGKAITPNPFVKLNGVTLTKGVDYTLTYKNNINAGTATLIVTGIGSYTGTKSVNFKIVSISESKVTFPVVANQVYTGSQIKPSVTLKYGTTVLKLNIDYTVTYGVNKEVGIGRVKITFKGNYTGTKILTFMIIPKEVTITKIANPSTKTIRVYYTESTGATGYQIGYRAKGSSTWTYVRTTAIARTISNLPITRYEIKVRPYATINSKNYYGAWSISKALNVK